MNPLFRKNYSELDLILQYQFESTNCIIIDVGAHHGSFSVPFALKGWKVIAFEPEKENREAYQKHLSPFQNVICIPKAVTDVSGQKVPFFISPEHFGIHALKPFHSTHTEAYEVETVCLDDALEESGVSEVTLLKIDAEGADFLALKGFNLTRYRPEMVILEFMDKRSIPHYGYSHHDVVEYMQHFDYVAFVSEWASIKEYGREGVKSAPHSWLQCAQYPLDHEPDWGNLLFIPRKNQSKFENNLNIYLENQSFVRRVKSGVKRLVNLIGLFGKTCQN